MERTGKTMVNVEKLGDLALFLPRLAKFLLRLSADRRIPWKQKAKFLASLAYLILPISIISRENHPFLGIVDDLVIALKGLRAIIVDTDRQVLLENWEGPEYQLDWIIDVVRRGDDAINNLASKIKEKLSTIVDKPQTASVVKTNG